MIKRETIVLFIKDMLRPRTLKEIIDIEMRDATISKMQAEKSLEYAMSVVDYNRQRIRRLEEKLLEIGGNGMTPEDEEFTRIEMESRVKQEYVRSMNRKRQIAEPRDAVVHLLDELAIARIAVRELGDRLSNVEKSNIQVRNETLDEIVKEIEHLAIVFGVDTVHTFMALIRSMKE